MDSKVHRVRFYNPKPQPINCVAVNKKDCLIALGRADASIEVWNVAASPYLTRKIPGTENSSIEAIAWVHRRLLSTGLSGALIEWDLEKLCQKTSVFLTGSAAWCLDVNLSNTLVAVGTEQGYINLYSVENDQIVYERLFDKQDGRVKCCKFHPGGKMLVTGSVDTIRVWNVEKGQATTKISVSRRSKEVMVWCVAMLSDNTVVSGDSHGRLTFWDGIMGDQIESFTTHRADILSLAITEDENHIYCAGVDPIVVEFVAIRDGSDKIISWVKHAQRSLHEHDVKELAIFNNKLVSVGINGYMTFSSYPPKWEWRTPHMPPVTRTFVCPSKKLLLLRFSNYLELWKLGSYSDQASDATTEVAEPLNNGNDENSPVEEATEEESTMEMVNKAMKSEKAKRMLKVNEHPIKLATIKTKNKKQIKCCELAPNGEYIIYSTDSDVRVLKLDIDDDQCSVSLSKVLVSGVTTGCELVAISQESNIVALHSHNTIHTMFVDVDAGATVLHSINIDKHMKSSALQNLLFSKKSQSGTTYMIVADCTGAVAIFSDKGKGKKFMHYVTLPKYQFLPTAMTVDDNLRLIVVYADHLVHEYDIERQRFTDFSERHKDPSWYRRESVSNSVTVHPSRNALVFQDDRTLCVLERDNSNQVTDEPQAKRHTNKTLCTRFIEMKYLAGFHWLSECEAVAIEMPPENIVLQLPPPIVFGNKWYNRPNKYT